ncbi:hypothetical protein ZWY2020_029982 [Hordeum vulgare]|nr:hypothetical protein ZWY2020_029982 [Hordeum vulgare]
MLRCIPKLCQFERNERGRLWQVGDEALAGSGAGRRRLALPWRGRGRREPVPRGRPPCADLLLNCDLPPPAKLFGPFPPLHRELRADDKGDGGKDVLLQALRRS